MKKFSEKNYRYSGISLEQALSFIKENLHYEKETERVPLTEALGRIAAEDMTAGLSQPPFDRSPLDGYALKGEDIKDACRKSPARLRIIDEVSAGGFCHTRVFPGTAVRIMTGAPIPAGADCVVRQEDTDYGEREVTIYQPVKPGSNICPAGEDFQRGERLILQETKLGAVELGILASMGCAEVPVYKKPRVALFTTGDELTSPGAELTGGKIYNSNLYVLQARLCEMGAKLITSENLADDAPKAAGRIEAVLPKADLIVTTGGVSVGKKDIMHQVMDLLHAEKIFWRVRVCPGSPVIFSVAKGRPFIALSGNPFGALNNLELIVRPVLYEMTKNPDCLLHRKQAVLVDGFEKASPKRRFLRGREKEGRVRLSPGGHASGILSSMAGCNCLVDIPPGSSGIRAGEKVEVIRLC